MGNYTPFFSTGHEKYNNNMKKNQIKSLIQIHHNQNKTV